MMKPIQVTGKEGGEDATYACIHWRNFPAKFAGFSETPEDLRALKKLDGPEYQRHKVWERECGILRMNEGKCLACPHVRKLDLQPHQAPQLVTLDGRTRTPAVDISAMEAIARYRRKDRKKTARDAAIAARGATQKGGGE